MSDEIKIESGIALPAARNAKGNSVGQKMKKGDSVLVDDQSAASVITWGIRCAGGKSAQRKQEDGKIRVWRIA